MNLLLTILQLKRTINRLCWCKYYKIRLCKGGNTWAHSRNHIGGYKIIKHFIHITWGWCDTKKKEFQKLVRLSIWIRYWWKKKTHRKVNIVGHKLTFMALPSKYIQLSTHYKYQLTSQVLWRLTFNLDVVCAFFFLFWKRLVKNLGGNHRLLSSDILYSWLFSSHLQFKYNFILIFYDWLVDHQAPTQTRPVHSLLLPFPKSRHQIHTRLMSRVSSHKWD